MNDAHDLDDLLAAARTRPVAAPPDLLARVLDDGLALQPRPVSAAPCRSGRGLWARLSGALGGAPALAGLAAATVAGLWLGFAQPTPVQAVADGLWPDGQFDTVELFPGDDLLLTEG